MGSLFGVRIASITTEIQEFVLNTTHTDVQILGFVLTEKGGKVGMIALILSIIAFVIAVVNLIFVTRR